MAITANAGSGFEERKLFFLLLALQLVMVVLLTTISLSPWYSFYFNSMMRDYYLQEHRLDRADSAALRKATAYSSKNARLFPDIELAEETARSALADKVSSAAAEKRLLNWSKSKNSDIAHIARPKAISLELLLARKALKQGSAQSASRHLQAAIGLIKFAPKEVAYSRTGYIHSYLALSAETAKLDNDPGLRSKFENLLRRFDSVVNAKQVYEELGVEGFELDYPISLRVQSMLSSTGNSDSDVQALNEAVRLLANPSVAKSTRTPLLAHGLAVARQKNDRALAANVLQSWYKGAHDHPNSREEAFLLLGLINESNLAPDPAIGNELLKSILYCIDHGLLDDAAVVSLVEDIPAYVLGLNLIYPDVAECPNKLAQVNALLKAAAKVHADERSLHLVAAALYQRVGKNDEARKIAVDVLSSNGALNHNRETLLAANLTSCAQTMPAQERSVFLEKVLSAQAWSTQSKKDIYLSLAQAYESLNQKSKWLATLAALYGDNKREPFENPAQMYRDEYRLRSLFVQGKLNEADTCFRTLKCVYGHNFAAWENLCRLHFAWLRAYPQYDAKHQMDAKNGLYPQVIFEESVTASKTHFGADSPIYSEVLLYFAEYEFCRGNLAQAKALCDQIIEKWTPESSHAYLAALDLANELAGKSLPLKNSYLVKAGSKAQIDSLHSIYSSAGKAEAKARLEKMLPLIKEQ